MHRVATSDPTIPGRHPLAPTYRAIVWVMTGGATTAASVRATNGASTPRQNRRWRTVDNAAPCLLHPAEPPLVAEAKLATSTPCPREPTDSPRNAPTTCATCHTTPWPLAPSDAGVPPPPPPLPPLVRRASCAHAAGATPPAPPPPPPPPSPFELRQTAGGSRNSSIDPVGATPPTASRGVERWRIPSKLRATSVAGPPPPPHPLPRHRSRDPSRE